MALAQQALMRAKIKRQRTRSKKKKRMSGFEKNKSEIQVAERLADISSSGKKSAMDLFLEAMEEPKSLKEASAQSRNLIKAKPKPKPKKRKEFQKKRRSSYDGKCFLSTWRLSFKIICLLWLSFMLHHPRCFNRPQLKAMWMTKKEISAIRRLEYAVAALSVLDALGTQTRDNLLLLMSKQPHRLFDLGGS